MGELTHKLEEVIEALKLALKEAENSGEYRWDASQANRWIDRRKSG
jgi:hypothetical protein